MGYLTKNYNHPSCANKAGGEEKRDWNREVDSVGSCLAILLLPVKNTREKKGVKNEGRNKKGTPPPTTTTTIISLGRPASTGMVSQRASPE